MNIKEIFFKKNIKELTLNELYKILVISAFILAIILITSFFITLMSGDFESVVKLLVPIGVLLSAGLASASVMKSIENTNKIEEEKYLKEKNFINNRLTVYFDKLYLATNSLRGTLGNPISEKIYVEELKELSKTILNDNSFISNIRGEMLSKLLSSLDMLLGTFGTEIDKEKREEYNKTVEENIMVLYFIMKSIASEKEVEILSLKKLENLDDDIKIFSEKIKDIE